MWALIMGMVALNIDASYSMTRPRLSFWNKSSIDDGTVWVIEITHRGFGYGV